MGRMLGVFDNDEELDRPDLNKCPDCGCFFGGDNCPLCGKPCPEEMRAGNRKPVKKQRYKRSSGSGRVTFIEWYHSWWFLILMMFIFPLVGIILLITSPHLKWKKILFVVIAAVYMLVSTFGFLFIPYFQNLLDRPVNTSIKRVEYVSRCEERSADTIYRSPTNCEGEYLRINLTVLYRSECVNDTYSKDAYYLCRANDGSEHYIIVRDCLIENQQNFLPGDVITVYGEGAGERTIINSQGNGVNTAPCINMAYVIVG
jgi:hypothetical protein